MQQRLGVRKQDPISGELRVALNARLNLARDNAEVKWGSDHEDFMHHI